MENSEMVGAARNKREAALAKAAGDTPPTYIEADWFRVGYDAGAAQVDPYKTALRGLVDAIEDYTDKTPKQMARLLDALTAAKIQLQ